MNRQEFFDELREYLKILEDEEQEDILAEYSQHIEMKMKSGLSEEEAIKDFGQVKELAAQILEAYHVNPEYEPDRGGKNGRIKNMSARFSALSLLGKGKEENQNGRRAGEESGENLGTDISRENSLPANLKKWLLRVSSQGGRQIRKGWQFLERQVRRPFTWIRKRIESMTAGVKEGAAPETMDKRRDEDKREKRERFVENGAGLLTGVSRGIRKTVRLIWRIAAGCFRLAWNGAVVFGTGFFGLLGLFSLFLFGMLTVLWIQGYPLAGLVCSCLGAVLCCMSLMLFVGTFFWKKKRGEQ